MKHSSHPQRAFPSRSGDSRGVCVVCVSSLAGSDCGSHWHWPGPCWTLEQSPSLPATLIGKSERSDRRQCAVSRPAARSPPLPLLRPRLFAEEGQAPAGLPRRPSATLPHSPSDPCRVFVPHRTPIDPADSARLACFRPTPLRQSPGTPGRSATQSATCNGGASQDIA
eukprot:scaffold79_cov259-Pinguiococcus_pyrenoidosus.AAC.31